ncbi:MarR family winged helix-turn-helix transcriptional regulator [Bosea sp. NBC_00550]|uniref:MarR family winged helix-turn-helix transcriptional regulator n=1 Tax=Bosea sp. NBC_00550 TaxID=2969621 RepID=UPI00222EB0FB|nr:MarR family winged helix-turn-helix transcriptional regulator [Bosea sp. NBC_00550]UZF93950.1 MarR family winged helix-turn-helix transcriptional regulator [Bosea sp. NBC_00550]
MRDIQPVRDNAACDGSGEEFPSSVGNLVGRYGECPYRYFPVLEMNDLLFVVGIMRARCGGLGRGAVIGSRLISDRSGHIPATMSIACYCTRLKTVTRKIAGLYDVALAPVGINIAQFAILRNVRRYQPVSLTELGRLLELDRSTMGRNIRVVEKMGLVSLGRGDDQRELVVSLSGQGEAVLEEASPLWETCQQDITGRLGTERLKALNELSDLL